MQALSLISLPMDQVAVGWNANSQQVVTIYDSKTGKKVQDLTGFTSEVLGLAYVGGHLLTVSRDGNLQVWDPSPSGLVGIFQLTLCALSR